MLQVATSVHHIQLQKLGLAPRARHCSRGTRALFREGESDEMRIAKHDKSYIVELSDSSGWHTACRHGWHLAVATDNGNRR
jgi:hypothetical protein